MASPMDINPKPVRVVENMGDKSIVDYLWFICFCILAFPLIFIQFPWSFSPLVSLIVHLLIMSPIVIIGACLAFMQSKTRGKLRWRLGRAIKFMFQNKSFNKIQISQLYSIKETKDNHVHYKNIYSEGVVSIHRIEGFDPSLLSDTQLQSLCIDLQKFFSANIRIKIYSSRISYTIPPKDFKLTIDHYGVNLARNRYLERINDINKNENLKQQAYFLVIDGPSINKNVETYQLLSSSLTDAHLQLRPANLQEMQQVLSTIWCGAFDFSDPLKKQFTNISFDSTSVRMTKIDGTHEYMSFLTFNSLPENAELGWLGRAFNSSRFSVLADFLPMSGEESSKYMEKISELADSIVTTKWFKKRASDAERLRIQHVKMLSEGVTAALAANKTQMKEAIFHIIFRANTRKQLKKDVENFEKSYSTFSDGWTVFNCKYLQRDCFINSRLYDVPSLQMKGISKKGISASGGASDYIKSTNLAKAIDHKILTTSLGLSFPFYSRASIATKDTWFKGFIIDESSGAMDPFFENYWKKNEMYNSFNRFYQGRNGSGKSYTADLDMVGDRLDDKFIISIDPKPERDILTKNLGGANLLIGANVQGASYINIFDVLVVPDASEDQNKSKLNPLLSQYQANLTSMSILLSLDTNNPGDKMILSCFNDVQIYVYEKLKNIHPTTDFFSVPKNKFPIMVDFYNEAIRRYKLESNPQTKSAYNELIVLMKEHAIGISSPLFNNYTNIDWSKNRMWNLIVRDIALNYGNKNILAVWTINIIRLASTFMYANQKVALYIDELHLIHDITGVLSRLDEFARVDRSFDGALCLINQNFNSIKAGGDLKKTEYYESIFTMSQYNLFFTTGDDDVMFLVQMLEGSGNPLSQSERSFITKAGRGKALLVMNAYDRYRVEFDISFWRDLWEQDLELIYLKQKQEIAANTAPKTTPANAFPKVTTLPGKAEIVKKIKEGTINK